MKNTLIFVLSNTQFRGLRLAIHKASLFCFRAKDVFPTYKAAACLYRALRSAIPAKVVCSTAVSGRPLFFSSLPTNVEHIHNAHRNQAPARPGQIPGAPNYQGAESETRRRNGAARPGNSQATFVEKIPTPTAGNAVVKFYLSTSLVPLLAHIFLSVHHLPNEAGQHAIEMKLAKKARIRAKQIKANKGRFERMLEIDILREFGKEAARLRKYWAKRGIIFSNR